VRLSVSKQGTRRAKTNQTSSDKMKLQFATVQTENNFGKKIVRVVSRHKTARAAIAASEKRADFQIAKLNFSGVLELTSPSEFAA